MNKILSLVLIAALSVACDHAAAPPAAAPGVPGAQTASEAPAPAPAWVFADRWAADRPQDAAKRPFDIAANYQIRNMSEPTWSPDGRRVLFVVTSYELETGTTRSHIWLASPGGPPPRQLTQGDVRDWGPRWHPAGASFLFVSLRGGESQIWTMPVDGGEPVQRTKVGTGVSDATWSADGAAIAFVSEVFPEHGADDAANRALLEDIAESPTKAYLADHLMYRHWNAWGDGRRKHVLLFDLASETLVDLTPGDRDAPASTGWGHAGFDLSPDGRNLCFAASPETPDAQAWSTNKDLYELPLAGGELRPLSAANPAYDGAPHYAPRGGKLAFVRQAVPGYESDRFRLAVLELASGASRDLAEGFDDWVLDFQWAKDGESLVFRAPREGRFPLFRAPLDGAAPLEIEGIPSALAWDLSPAGDIVFTNSAVGRPVELFVRHAADARVERLTALNDEVAATYDIRPVEEMWVEGAAGRKVHVLLVKPHGFVEGRRYPLVLNVHGGPQYQWADVFRADWQVYPGAGYVVAFPNPHGSIGYGQAYTEGISKDYGGKVMQDIAAVTEALAALPFVDPARMGAMGWSWGGYAMAWLLGNTDRFKAFAAMMPVYDLPSFYGATEELWFPEYDIGATPWENPAAYLHNSPSHYAANFKTPTLILTGEQDFRVPYTQGLQLFTALRRQDVPARLIVFPNDGHWPAVATSMPLYYAAHLDWFHRYLGGEPSPYDLTALVRGRAFSSPASAPQSRP